MSTLTLPTLDPIQVIRSRPKMYLGVPEATGDILLTRLVGDLVLMTEAAIFARHTGEWWLVACEEDWLSRDPRLTEQDYFARVIPFPEVGVNSMHAEVLLSAFAEEVVSGTPIGLNDIKGSASSDQRLNELARMLPMWKRLIAFRMAKT